jgi:hypothetical protein
MRHDETLERTVVAGLLRQGEFGEPRTQHPVVGAGDEMALRSPKLLTR